MAQHMNSVVLTAAGETAAIDVVRRDPHGLVLSIGGITYLICDDPQGRGVMLDGRVVPLRLVRAAGADEVHVEIAGEVYLVEIHSAIAAASGAASNDGVIAAAMPGRVVAVRVAAGDFVETGAELAVMESMKLHISLTAPRKARVLEVLIEAGATVDKGEPLIRLRETTTEEAADAPH
jgi:biotin carboxyl carrier protein